MRLSGRSDRLLAPGQSDSVKVTLQSKGRSGPLSKVIRVTTNDPANKNATLTCKGSVRSAFAGRAPSVGFGQIQRDSGSVTKTIKLKRGDAGPITPEVLPIGQPGVTAAIREIEAGETYDLDVTLSPPWPNQRIRLMFDVKTGIAKAPLEQIRISADVAPRVRTVPPNFTIPQKFPSASDYTADVVWDREGPQKVVGAEVNDPKISVRVEEGEDKQQLVVHVPAGYERGRRQALVVTVRTDDEDVPEFSVPIRFQRPSRARGAQPPVNKSETPGRTNVSQRPSTLKRPTTARRPAPAKVTAPVKSTRPKGEPAKPKKDENKKEKEPSADKDR